MIEYIVKMFLAAVVGVGGFLLWAAFITIPLYLAWNWALVDALPIAQLPKLTIPQTFGVIVAFRFLIPTGAKT